VTVHSAELSINYNPDAIDFNSESWVSWLTPVDDAPNRETWLLEAVERMSFSLFPAFNALAGE
jgi:hypothetical protein